MQRVFGGLLAAAGLLLAGYAALAEPGDTAWTAPAFPGLGPPPAPADNPTTEAKVTLGRFLFYDSRLSGPGYMSCGTCHQPALGFAEDRRQAIGITGERHPRNTPGLANVGYFPVLTWADPTATALETQSSTPLFGTHPVEMMAAPRRAEILLRFSTDGTYRRLFAAAFPEAPDAVDFEHIQMALAAFQRTLISADSPYDRHAADPMSGAMDAAAVRGMELFMSDRLGCAGCHAPPFFTDTAYHNTGLYDEDGAGALPEGNQGIVEYTGDPADMGRFRTPSLRNVAVTGPYMHDGSVATLEEAVDHYAAGGRAGSPLTDPLVTGFALDAGERADLVAFLEALTDETFLTNPAIQSPFRYQPEALGD